MRMVAGIFAAAFSSFLGSIVASCGPKLSNTGDRCGDSKARIHYRECAAASDEVTCQERGGAWLDANAKLRNQSCGPSGKCKMTEGMPAAMRCSCPLTDAGCPCAAPSDCVGACYAAAEAGDCTAATKGTCGEAHRFGCQCVMSESGPTNLCI